MELGQHSTWSHDVDPVPCGDTARYCVSNGMHGPKCAGGRLAMNIVTTVNEYLYQEQGKWRAVQ